MSDTLPEDQEARPSPLGDATTVASPDADTSPRPRRSVEDVLAELRPGNVIAGRYRVVERLGAGGMGMVYRAEHITLEKPVALKLLSPRHLGDETLARRFIQEARAASTINHPNVVHISDFGHTARGAAFFVMEHLEGEDLSKLLRREGPLAPRRVVDMVLQIADALATAHRAGVIHRDIKPANCFVSKSTDTSRVSDFVKVLDFGLAKLVDPERGAGDGLTNSGAVLGTPGYIAPELYRGAISDFRVDIFALGVLTHKLLTNRLPPVDGSALDPARELPPRLVAIIERCVAERPSDRFQTVRELVDELQQIRDGLSTVVSLVAPGSGPGPQFTKDETLLAASDGASGDGSSAGRERPTTPSGELFTITTTDGHTRFSMSPTAIALLVLTVTAAVLSLLWILIGDRLIRRDRGEPETRVVYVDRPVEVTASPPEAPPPNASGSEAPDRDEATTRPDDTSVHAARGTEGVVADATGAATEQSGAERAPGSLDAGSAEPAPTPGQDLRRQHRAANLAVLRRLKRPITASCGGGLGMSVKVELAFTQGRPRISSPTLNGGLSSPEIKRKVQCVLDRVRQQQKKFEPSSKILITYKL